MNTSTPRAECLKGMSLLDFVEFYEDLANESERVKKHNERGDGHGK
jgi:hypothetical protein